jgi:hypothetical protein
MKAMISRAKMICMSNCGQVAGMVRLALLLLVAGLAGVLRARTLADIGFAAPTPGNERYLSTLHQRQHDLAGRVAV